MIMQGKVQVEKIGNGGKKFRVRDEEYMARKKKMNKPARKQRQIEF